MNDLLANTRLPTDTSNTDLARLLEVRCARCCTALLSGEGGLCDRCRLAVVSPTRLRPGSPDKMELLSYRALLGIKLHVEGDLHTSELVKGDFEARPHLGLFVTDDAEDDDEF